MSDQKPEKTEPKNRSSVSRNEKDIKEIEVDSETFQEFYQAIMPDSLGG